MPHRLLSRLLVLCLVASLGGTLWGPPVGAAEHGARRTASSAAPGDVATDALARAQTLLAGPRTSRTTATASARDATMVLRDLARHAEDLPTAAQRATASRILARPTSSDDPTGGDEHTYTSPSGRHCGTHICVHWVEDATADSAKGIGNDGNLATVPAWVSTTRATLETVYRKEVGSLGYSAPLSDGARGGDGRVDVYLADLGSRGVYGYCTTDQPDASYNRRVFAYCVLDNDFSPTQFGYRQTRAESLRVTAAHEFFHAIQFGYDWTEDSWLMEGTAAWMEDEVFDGVNDNLQYLRESPLAFPYVPLDYSGYDYQPYGAWVFWKFLSESAGRGRFDSPRIIRDVWRAAVGPTYSTAALRKVLEARGTSFSRVFGTFGTWMRDPARYFSEGRTYRAAPLEGRFTLTRTRPSTGLRGTRMDHMTHSFVRLSPGSTLRGAWRVRISVDMVDRSRGSSARVVVHRRRGAPSAYAIPLSRSGSGTRVLGFRRAVITHLELDLVNGSVRFHCNRGTSQSCRGVGYDDRVPARLNVRAIR